MAKSNQRESTALTLPPRGEQLGIVGPEDTTDLTSAKPTLAGTALLHSVMELKFNKSIADGVNIYSKRDNDADSPGEKEQRARASGFAVSVRQIQSREFQRDGKRFSLSLEERAGVRSSV